MAAFYKESLDKLQVQLEENRLSITTKYRGAPHQLEINNIAMDAVAHGKAEASPLLERLAVLEAQLELLTLPGEDKPAAIKWGTAELDAFRLFNWSPTASPEELLGLDLKSRDEFDTEDEYKAHVRSALKRAELTSRNKVSVDRHPEFNEEQRAAQSTMYGAIVKLRDRLREKYVEKKPVD